MLCWCLWNGSVTQQHGSCGALFIFILCPIIATDNVSSVGQGTLWVKKTKFSGPIVAF